MRTLDQVVLPLSALIIAAIGGVLADRAALLRRKDRDRGDYWTSVVWRLSLFIALVLLSGMVAVIPRLWDSGYHLHFDLTGVAGWSWSIPWSYRVALLLPFGVWSLLLMLGLAEKPAGREAGRWLAGAIGFDGSRLWVLVWTIPLAGILVAAFSNLGGGSGAYPAAAWGSLATLLLALIGVALSRGEAIDLNRETTRSDPKPTAQLIPWPEALSAHGLQLRHVTSWQQSGGARGVRRPSAFDLVDRLRMRGARSVAPELIEAIDGLLNSSDSDRDRNRLVFAPDDCGQAEVIALTAELLEQRFHAATLVVTARNAHELAEEVGRWLPERRVAAIDPTGEVDPNALILVCDAQLLSDRFLPQLKNPMLLKRFGLVVWWHLEAYTGVLAANLWAISRRLHRLFEAMGRHDVRTLAFVRSTPHGGAQLAAFVRRLLPHPMPVECEVHVEPRFARPLHLHVLESHENFFARGEGRNVSERYRHLALVAAKVSVEEGWRTRIEVPPDVTDNEAQAFLQLPTGKTVLAEKLEPAIATAGARVKTLEAGDVLSLPEIISQGGRAAEEGLPHHVGVTLPANPYVAHLVSALAHRNGSDGFPTSRRLVSAAAQPDVIRRHLLLALDELPDTRTGLLKNFLWDEETIQRTLEEIANQGKLTRREVRFLDANGELQREHEYKSTRVPAGERRPLDTVGSRLIDVRDPAAGHEPEQGVRMRVDPERLTIQAYPHRVFVHNGQRYRIHEWSSSPDGVTSDGWLSCSREDIYSLTWRIRNANVFAIDSNDAAAGIGRSGKLLSRLTVSLTYEEEVVGTLRVTPDLTTGREPRPETLRLARPVARSFATRALVLRFPDEVEQVALASVAQAFRHLLPVHLGVEEDALEVVPLTGELVQNRETFGLAIVDLYPGGIGLVDAIADDNSFLLHLLESACEWLAACSCRSDQGCVRCLRSPAALAANIDLPPMRSAALALVRQVV